MMTRAISARSSGKRWRSSARGSPDRGAAELAAGMCLAHALLSGALTVAECSRWALGTWDFDDVIYPGLPGDLKDLVLMCHLLGTEHYAPNGGDERLLAAARALAARSR